jgi:hypothetical protein
MYKTVLKRRKKNMTVNTAFILTHPAIPILIKFNHNEMFLHDEFLAENVFNKNCKEPKRKLCLTKHIPLTNFKIINSQYSWSKKCFQ